MLTISSVSILLNIHKCLELHVVYKSPYDYQREEQEQTQLLAVLVLVGDDTQVQSHEGKKSKQKDANELTDKRTSVHCQLRLL